MVAEEGVFGCQSQEKYFFRIIANLRKTTVKTPARLKKLANFAFQKKNWPSYCKNLIFVNFVKSVIVKPYKTS